MKKPDDSNHFAYIGIVFGVFAAFIWGGFPVATKMGIENTLTPYDIGAIRFLTAGVVLLPIFFQKRLKGVSVKAVLVICCGAGVPYLLVVANGLTLAPAAHFGLITPCSMMIFSSLGGWLFWGNIPTVSRLFGMFIVCLGLLLIAWEGLSNVGEDVWIGDALLLLGGFLWATYTVASKHWNLNALHAAAIVSVISMLIYLPVYGLFMDSNIATASLGEISFQVIFQGILSAVVALMAYTQAVKILGAERGAVFGAMVPAFALILSFVFLEEALTGLQLVGVVVVTTGMLIAVGLLKFKQVQRAYNNT